MLQDTGDLIKKDNYRDFSAFGGLPIYIMILMILYTIGEMPALKQLAAGLVIAYIITVFFRVFYFKQRPEKQKYKNFIEKIDAGSFPSLHAMRSAILGVVLASYFANVLLTVIFALCIIGVAITRVLLKRHDPVDVSAGMGIGLAVGFVIILHLTPFLASFVFFGM
ncbi:MAG: phosphatase PAP2 family protein [Candidatus Aenigmarchaeota archaeon]|nr:phosphatase PAP2 family protein [Candidatus Aenigmarchaeota archaeon]